MKNTFLIGSLIRVGAEVVSLGLDQVGGKAFSADGVEIGEGGRKTGCRNAVLYEGDDGFAEGGRTRIQDLGKCRIQKQVRQCGIGRVGGADILEQA